MTEPGPISFSLVGMAAAALGPVLGPYALVVFAAAVGAMLAMSKHRTASRWEGAKFVALATVLALLLTGPVLWAVHTFTPVPANVALIPVAFVLGARRDQLLQIVTKLLDFIPAVVRAALERAGFLPKGGKR